MIEATPLASASSSQSTASSYDPFVQPPTQGSSRNSYFKPLLAGLSILVFVGIASLGVLISRQQEQTPGPVAPNVPASQPKAAQFNSNAIESCENIFTVVANGVAGCDSKRATTFVDQNSNILPRDIPAGSTIQAGQTFVYWITVSAATQTTGAVTITDTLPTSITYVDPHHSNPSFVQMSHANGVVTANLGVIGNSDANRLVRVGIVVRASQTIAAGRYSNSASVATTGSDSKPSSCDVYHVVEQYACGSSCTTDAQCQTANSGYTCYQNSCRLASNTASTTCQPAATATPTPSPSPTATPTPSPTATPAPTYSCNSPCTSNAQCATGNSNHICYNGYCRLSSNPADSSCYPVEKTQVGCNDMCNTNADCRNSNHICYTTGDGSKRCRLDNYVTSTTCNIPVVIQSTPAPTTQPQLPAELPQTGPGEWANWMKAGLVTLVVGVGLLLML